METYVITGEVARQFRTWLLANNPTVINELLDLPKASHVTIGAIRSAVTRKYLGEMKVKISTTWRGSLVVKARHIAFYLAKKHTNYSYPDIARIFGGLHHTTVMHGVEKIEGLLATDAKLAAEVSDLERELTA